MHMPKTLSGVIAAVAATLWLIAQPRMSAATSNQCVATPGASTPRGQHWYYRIDRSSNRRCWYPDSIAAAPQPAAPNAAALPQAASDQPAPFQREADAATESQQVAAPEQTASEFAVRWPDLPRALNLAAFKFSELTSGYAEMRLVSDAEPQMPSQWPILETETAEPQQPHADKTDFAPPFLTIAVSIASLLFAACGIRLGMSAYRTA